MVGANTFREPTLTAKLATTLDHISGGRAILGVGAAWYEAEHRAFGFDFGSGPPERLRWLDEALGIMRGMLDGSDPVRAGPRYRPSSPLNLPPPIQRRVPILVGGGGEQVTLRLVAKWADMNNLGGGIAMVQRKEAILRRHCDELGRDHGEIERTAGIGIVVIRDRHEDAERAFRQMMRQNGLAQITGQPVGTPADVAATLAPYLELGYDHLIAEFPAPHDEESMRRLISDVRPMLGRS
jgi:alkanesulfonate monooxygenase SsuD/methylene tetrahydromethanopterin reductase-like flavin-dependent oxidoreductase (luciferase family)